MRRVQALIFVAGCFCVLGGPANSHSFEKDSVQIIHPWAEPASGGVSRVYPTISNEGKSEIVLIGAVSPVADSIEMIVDGRIVDRHAVAGGDVAAFTEPDTHFRLLGLDAPLEEGGIFSMTLQLDDGNEIEIDVVIGETTAAPERVRPGQAMVNLTHDPIPDICRSARTIDLALPDGAGAGGLSVGDVVDFDLSFGPDGIFGLAGIWPAGSAPAAGDDVIRGQGTINALTLD